MPFFNRSRPALHASVDQLLDLAADAVVVTDANGLIRLVNKLAVAMFDYEREELLGAQLDMLVPDRVREVHPQHRAGYFLDPRPRPMGEDLVLTARRKDGTEFPVDISLSSVETEDGVLVSAAVRDVTERKRLEEAQAVLEADLQQAHIDEERAVLEAQLHPVATAREHRSAGRRSGPRLQQPAGRDHQLRIRGVERAGGADRPPRPRAGRDLRHPGARRR